MKKLLFVLAVFCVSCTAKPKVSAIESLPIQGKCIYSVECAKPYTFIEDCGKYKIGDVIE